ncbi:conjugal transfer protein TraC [Jiella pacifica]|uniref:Conjugal transfer protein TraC n=1 Tax=Jiella pacifica TaxID=2696469 RepID=A0A6N9TCA1_9HYPH|nr:conjugal transfer protein TraC [Jiella pacifica]NDW07706.1 conjugal transfer protein TraC [Jiella pacifica]
MKKPSSKIREEITRLQNQLKAAETREAERIGRLALKAGLGDIEIDEAKLLGVFEEVAKRFRTSGADAKQSTAAPIQTVPAAGQDREV